MHRTNSTAAHLVPFLVVASIGILSGPADAQLARREPPPRQNVTGRVCMPDGSPAVGASVGTSAGGLNVTGADGHFALELEPPLDVESVEVTAVAEADGVSGSLVASVRFVPAALAPGASVGTLALTLSPNGHPRWLPTFGGEPGTNRVVKAIAVFDDGGGPALYVAGELGAAGGVAAAGIAKWDGASWSALGSGVPVASPNDSIRALAVYDDGGGPALFAGGHFSTAGGGAVSHVAKWDGTSWSGLGSGVDSFGVDALAVFDDGGGPALYAGGSFISAGGVAASHVARWDGTSWSALGNGVDDSVLALTVFDDGSGPALYAGGYFSTAGGVAASGIARWDGSSWSPLGSGVAGAVGTVYALAVYDDGSGPALYAGGAFTSAGGVAASWIARWDGTGWSALGSGLGGVNSAVYALAVVDEASGPALFAAGALISRARAESHAMGSRGGTARAGRRSAAELAPSGHWAPTTTAAARRSSRAATSRARAAWRRSASRSGTARAGRRSAARSGSTTT